MKNFQALLHSFSMLHIAKHQPTSSGFDDDLITQLPDDLLATIFSWLTTKDRFAVLPTVCKHWQNVFRAHPICWEELQIDAVADTYTSCNDHPEFGAEGESEQDVAQYSLSTLLRSVTSQWTRFGHSPPVKRVSMWTCGDHDDCPTHGPCCMPEHTDISRLAEWQALTHIDINLSGCAAMTHNLMQILSTLPNLSSLTLREPRVNGVTTGEQRVLDLSSIQSPHLKHVLINHADCDKVLLPPSVRHLILQEGATMKGAQCSVPIVDLQGVSLLSLHLAGISATHMPGLDTQCELQEFSAWPGRARAPRFVREDGPFTPRNPFANMHNLKTVAMSNEPKKMAQFLQHAAFMPQLEAVCYSGALEHRELKDVHGLPASCRLSLVLSAVTSEHMRYVARWASGMCKPVFCSCAIYGGLTLLHVVSAIGFFLHSSHFTICACC